MRETPARSSSEYAAISTPVASAQPVPERCRGARARAGAPAQAPVHEEDARRHQDHPERAERRQALVEERERGQRHERDPEPARDGVDEGEVARRVGAPEREEVERVEEDGADHERDGGGPEALAASTATAIGA